MAPSITRAASARRRRRWTAAEKTTLLAEFAASRLSATAFCRERHVPRATLTLWQRDAHALSEPDVREAAPRFAAVEVVPAPERAPSAAAALTLLVHIHVPTRIRAEFTGLDVSTAAALLRVVLTAGAA